MSKHVILGLWPIAGITSGSVAESDGEATIRAAMESGIEWFDTAFSYGYVGESDRLLGRCLGNRRDDFAVIGKAGQRWTADKERVIDCSPETLISDAESSLRRIGIEQFDLFMLHAVDPNVDIRRSAEAVVEIKERGWAKEIGVCNVNLEQLNAFCEVSKPSAIQQSLNMLQRELLQDIVPKCIELDIQVHVYWVLMKGILAGKMSPDHQFQTGDSRSKYDIYNGEYRRRTHRLVERLKMIADEASLTVAQLSIGWAISQPGISAALVGAKRAEQILETAEAVPLSEKILEKVERACEEEDVVTPKPSPSLRASY